MAVVRRTAGRAADRSPGGRGRSAGTRTAATTALAGSVDGGARVDVRPEGITKSRLWRARRGKR
ncbi:hypothetical protein ADK67_11820 [Saccharothrix sp. NRRL B-16348]|uniref:hypothetical protein n=1 Tax=Saccharothrix sp. NRRL B-16348 TaxID=1415542 RepID=UPI0006C30C34|nr:hypothetical protein [Saccharothrix sp. NRRL B-16348]KOX28140.1 hypothetical protein ADK67_11820 [Saccharothrix sp. NRRL B-16348]